MRYIIEGLLTVLKHLFKKPVTLEYPEKHRPIPDTFRGKPVVKGCIGCGICKKVCPSDAITYTKNNEGQVISYIIDLKKCIFCGNCSFYCPQNAITMTKNFELATDDKQELILNFKGGVND